MAGPNLNGLLRSGCFYTGMIYPVLSSAKYPLFCRCKLEEEFYVLFILYLSELKLNNTRIIRIPGGSVKFYFDQ
jgi:hypothetical protein